jgi:hypothetical protein
MLEQIKIASPCSADWDQMKGNDQLRFCGECKKNVFNLSAMTRRDAEALLKETNGTICVRLYRRSDGTTLTEDCPVGLRMKIARLKRRVAWAIAGAMGFAIAGCSTPLQGSLVIPATSEGSKPKATATDSKPAASQPQNPTKSEP